MNKDAETLIALAKKYKNLAICWTDYEAWFGNDYKNKSYQQFFPLANQYVFMDDLQPGQIRTFPNNAAPPNMWNRDKRWSKPLSLKFLGRK